MYMYNQTEYNERTKTQIQTTMNKMRYTWTWKWCNVRQSKKFKWRSVYNSRIQLKTSRSLTDIVLWHITCIVTTHTHLSAFSSKIVLHVLVQCMNNNANKKKKISPNITYKPCFTTTYKSIMTPITCVYTLYSRYFDLTWMKQRPDSKQTSDHSCPANKIGDKPSMHWTRPDTCRFTYACIKWLYTQVGRAG
jgi:hypothetical protein